jgi:hypothetical protein
MAREDICDACLLIGCSACHQSFKTGSLIELFYMDGDTSIPAICKTCRDSENWQQRKVSLHKHWDV